MFMLIKDMTECAAATLAVPSTDNKNILLDLNGELLWKTGSLAGLPRGMTEHIACYLEVFLGGWHLEP